MEWLLANWVLFSPVVVPFALWIFKRRAKKSPNVWDDKLVTFLAGLWDVYRGRTLRHTTGKVKPEIVEKYSRGGEEPED